MDAALYSATSGILSASIMSMMLPFIMLIQVLSTFFLGLMFYYFIGHVKAGEALLAKLMRSTVRIYAHTWTFIAMLMGLIGSGLVVKSFLGLFPDFVYKTSRFGSDVAMRTNDFKTGAILLIIAVIIYAIHLGVLVLVQTGEERKGTLSTKLFYAAGLITTSIVYFSALVAFVFGLLMSAPQIGATMAWVVGAFPFWLLYLVKTMWVIREEKRG